MLSSMLNAFVIPTSQSVASASASQWFETIVTLSPLDEDDGRRGELRARASRSAAG